MTVLVMATGSGGHVFPALAVARRLREQGAEVAWLGTTTGLESRVVPQAGFPIARLRVSGIRGKGLARRISGPLLAVAAGLQALSLMLRSRPSLVLGMGGYASGPGGVAARCLGIPLLIHEQNAVPGITNRLLAPIASRVLEAFPGSFAASRGASHTGNPVRDDIAALEGPDERHAGRDESLRVLIVGGSQGAAALNAAVPGALGEAARSRRVAVLHQTGAADRTATVERYRGAGVEADVREFIDDMAEAYAWADVVVCRAGAMTIAELSAAGVASVLVPFPHAVDDHQTRNARFLADGGAAVLLPQASLTPSALAEVLLGLDRARLARMASAARARAVPDATDRVVAHCREVARD